MITPPTTKMTEEIIKKIKKVKEERGEWLKQFKEYFKDEELSTSYKIYYRCLREEFIDYIVEQMGLKRKKRKAIRKKLGEIINNDHYFALKKSWNWIESSPFEEYENFKEVLLLIKKYAGEYKRTLQEKELQRLTGTYEKMIGGKPEKSCECGADLPKEARYCPKCGKNLIFEKKLIDTIYLESVFKTKTCSDCFYCIIKDYSGFNWRNGCKKKNIEFKNPCATITCDEFLPKDIWKSVKTVVDLK